MLKKKKMQTLTFHLLLVDWLFEVSYDTKNSRVIFPVGSNASILLKQIWERACHYILQMKAVQVPNKFVLVTKSIPTENIFL